MVLNNLSQFECRDLLCCLGLGFVKRATVGTLDTPEMWICGVCMAMPASLPPSHCADKCDRGDENEAECVVCVPPHD